MSNEFTTLTYDIETGLSDVEVFSLGEQVIRHNQLKASTKVTPILCLSYAMNNEKPKTIITGPDVMDSKELIIEFDELVAMSDVVIGKNNRRFDDKHVNTHRLLHQLPGMPEWRTKVDDLESQLRRNFHMLSQSLDHISNILQLGGKVKMDFSDWQDIKHYREAQCLLLKTGNEKFVDVYCLHFYHKSLKEIKGIGDIAEKKMQFYNRKDVEDTRAIWNYAKAHFEPKHNRSERVTKEKAYIIQGIQCKNCGSLNVRKNGAATNKAGQEFQNFFCTEHNGFAGKAPLLVNGKYGKVT